LQEGIPEETDLSETLKETIFLLRSRLEERKIRLEVCNSTPVIVPLTKDQVKQVFLNLFYNSIDALERVKRVKSKNIRIEVRALPGGREVEVHFQDNGIGIPQKQVDMIFEPFYTTKEKGTGLGLYNIQREILRVGGDIQVKSTEGKGTLFILKLPVIAKEEGCV